MDKVWKFLSDTDIYTQLAEDGKLDDEFFRLMFIELLSRIKKLEQINFALQAMLIEKNLIDDGTLQEAFKRAKEHLTMKDFQKSKIAMVIRESGISFREWVNFTVNGTFDGQSPGDL